MQIVGQFQFDGVAAEALWQFLTDANRIAECLPGCEQLTHTGDGSYNMQMSIGIGAIRGVFSGQIRLHDLNPTSEYQMTVTGKGAPGFVKGEGRVRLTVSEAGTLLDYSGDVNAGGAIASVGQRMIGGAARMVIDRYFKCVTEKLRLEKSQ
jgi:carbon monoxide dehydrogenase subunit G